MARQHQFRIIGGQWRGRRLSFPRDTHAKPTKEAVRETLFNWLQPSLEKSVCLDMYAGSGSLTFEALSRGAGLVVAADSDRTLVRHYRRHARELNTEDTLEIIHTEWPKHLDRLSPYNFDIVFLDPPFHSDLLSKSLGWLQNANCLQNHGLIYLETDRFDHLNWLPTSFVVDKAKLMGGVQYLLLRFLLDG